MCARGRPVAGRHLVLRLRRRARQHVPDAAPRAARLERDELVARQRRARLAARTPHRARGGARLAAAALAAGQSLALHAQRGARATRPVHVRREQLGSRLRRPSEAAARHAAAQHLHLSQDDSRPLRCVAKLFGTFVHLTCRCVRFWFASPLLSIALFSWQSLLAARVAR